MSLEQELYGSLKHPLATKNSRGRYKPVESDSYRTDFQRDVHRIIYSQAFRRLRHKTQVFYFPQNDHVTTRMDHVLFVASAARTCARCLGLNEDLVEAISLGHDLGHPPFGHQGEKFINEIINDERYENLKKAMPEFHHEIFGLRVVDKLAKRDREVPGLNLTWEVRDGILSHCGEDVVCKYTTGDPNKILENVSQRQKDEKYYPVTLEGCLVRLIDKIAYCGKDIEDALEVELFRKEDIPSEINTELGQTNGQIVGEFLKDLIKTSKNEKYIALSEKKSELLRDMIKFNSTKIYNSSKAKEHEKQARDSLKLLFEDLLDVLNGRFNSQVQPVF